MNLRNGGRLLVIADQRSGDITSLRSLLETQLATLGQPSTFQVWTATHHLQHGFVSGGHDAVMRGQQLGALTRALSDVIAARNATGPVVGDVLIVSVHGSPDAPLERSLVDPGIIWILRELGFGVFAASGGGSELTAAQDVSVVEVTLDSGQRMSAVAATQYPGLRPSNLRVNRANAALRTIEAQITQLRAELAMGGLADADQTRIRGEITAAQTRHQGLTTARDAYLSAIDAQLGRSTRRSDPTHGRPAVAPSEGGAPPAQAEAAALDALLVGTPDPPSGTFGELNASAFVVLGREGSLTRLTPQAQGLLQARDRVRTLGAGLRASSPPEARAALFEALETYRLRLGAAIATAPAGTREILTTELGRVDRDLPMVTGYSGVQLAEMREAARLAAQAAQNVNRPAVVPSVEALTDGATATRIARDHGGLATTGGQLFRVTISGRSVSVGLEAPRLVEAPRTEPAAGARGGSRQHQRPALRGGGGPLEIPGGFFPRTMLDRPNVLNFSGQTIVVDGRTFGPTPSVPAMQGLAGAAPGDVVIMGVGNRWIVSDMRTRRPIAGVFQGGEWWRLQTDGTWVMEVDLEGNVARAGTRAVTARVGDPYVPGDARIPRRDREAVGGAGGGGIRVVGAGVLAVLVIASEVMTGLARVAQSERAQLERRRAQLRFWTQFGARPTFDLRTPRGEARPVGTPADVNVFSPSVYHYITAIDTGALSANLGSTLGDYSNFLFWLALGQHIGAIGREPQLGRAPNPDRNPFDIMWHPPTPEERLAPRRYHAFLDWPEGEGRRALDITSVIDPIERRFLAELDASVRRRVGGWTEAQRGQVFRLRQGSATPLYRASWGQPIRSAPYYLGPRPWVRSLEVRGGRTKVEPANADAASSAAMSLYQINNPIWEVYDEVTNHVPPRPILGTTPERARGRDLQGFVAGPIPGDARFGSTRYFRHEQYGDIWTVAVGQLDHFWVDSDQLEPVARPEVDTYARGRP